MNYQFENTIEELYSCLPNNRKKFNSIMDSMKKRFLKFDVNPYAKNTSNQIKTPKKQKKRSSKNLFSYRQIPSSPTKIKDINKYTFKKNEQNMNPYIQNNINFNDFKTQRNLFSTSNKELNNNNNFSHKRSMSNGFQGTLPDALLINPRPFRANSKQKMLTDTHANCNFFYPDVNIFYGQESDNVGNCWHNQANNIMYKTNKNFFNENN